MRIELNIKGKNDTLRKKMPYETGDGTKIVIHANSHCEAMKVLEKNFSKEVVKRINKKTEMASKIVADAIGKLDQGDIASFELGCWYFPQHGYLCGDWDRETDTFYWFGEEIV